MIFGTAGLRKSRAHCGKSVYIAVTRHSRFEALNGFGLPPCFRPGTATVSSTSAAGSSVPLCWPPVLCRRSPRVPLPVLYDVLLLISVPLTLILRFQMLQRLTSLVSTLRLQMQTPKFSLCDSVAFYRQFLLLKELLSIESLIGFA